MIFIGIGSKLPSKFGNRIQNINFAISFLEEKGIKIIKKSSFYETSSQPNTSDQKFLNVVISVKTNFSPSNLISIFLTKEKKLGRKRKKKMTLEPVIWILLILMAILKILLSIISN